MDNSGNLYNAAMVAAMRAEERKNLMQVDSRNLTPRAVKSMKVGRNEPCPCGSGKKFKKCHLGFVNP
jgi:uncharacterized protein YecA (UPF0149 family)